MKISFLNLNENKIQGIWFGKSDLCGNSAGLLAPFCHLAVKHFDLTFDSSFKLYEKISAVVKSSFFQLMIAKVKTYPSLKDPEKVIRPLITSRIDYCNALYVSLD